MSKKKNPLAYSEGHIYYIILEDSYNNKYIGKAKCNEEDYDFESEKIGYTIAHMRATIKLAKARKQQLQNELKGLNQLYYSINRSKHYNKKSYEAKMLFRQIKIKEFEINSIQEIINDIKTSITNYISDKEEFHQKLRKNREEGQN